MPAVVRSARNAKPAQVGVIARLVLPCQCLDKPCVVILGCEAKVSGFHCIGGSVESGGKLGCFQLSSLSAHTGSQSLVAVDTYQRCFLHSSLIECNS